MALIIGLTGSIASGKSTVSNMFATFNIPLIDADKIAREIVYPGEGAYHEIVLEFGEGILLEDQSIDRKKLGHIIFSNDNKREKLNAIMHPAIRMKMLQARDAYIESGEKCVVLDIPLLFESKLTYLVNKTMVVYVDEGVQLQRLMTRDHSTIEEAKQRISSQIPVSDKTKLADVVIDNNGSINETYNQLEAILKKWHIIS